jgi:hypothetical protein
MMSAPARWEYLAAIHARYRQATRKDKGPILDEFCRNTGYHRKYALRLLNGPPPGPERPRRRRRPVTYSPAMLQALRVIWEAAGYPWSVRLKALIPLWLPWARRRLQLSPRVCQQLRRISARQIDRRLAPTKRQLRRRRYGRTKPGTLLKHHIPLKTDHWDVTVPGFTELDLVAHPGHRADGEFAHSLNVTDIHTTWVETRAVLGRSETRDGRLGPFPTGRLGTEDPGLLAPAMDAGARDGERTPLTAVPLADIVSVRRMRGMLRREAGRGQRAADRSSPLRSTPQQRISAAPIRQRGGS